MPSSRCVFSRPPRRALRGARPCRRRRRARGRTRPSCSTAPTKTRAKPFSICCPIATRPTSLVRSRAHRRRSRRARDWRGCARKAITPPTVTPEASEEPASRAAGDRARPALSLRRAELVLSSATRRPRDADASRAHAHRRACSADAPARAASVLEAEASARARAAEGRLCRRRRRRAARRRRSRDRDASRRSSTSNAGALARLGERARRAGHRVPPELRRQPAQLGRRATTYTPEALAATAARPDVDRRGVARDHAARPRRTRTACATSCIEVEPAQRNAYELGLGYSTTEGAGVEARMDAAQFHRPRRRADASRRRSAELQQGVSVELTRPHAAGLGHAVSFRRFGGARGHRRLSRAKASRSTRSVDASPRLRLGRSYGVRLSADQYDDIASGGVTDAVVLSGFADIRHDTTDFTLDPRDGSIVELPRRAVGLHRRRDARLRARDGRRPHLRIVRRRRSRSRSPRACAPAGSKPSPAAPTTCRRIGASTPAAAARCAATSTTRIYPARTRRARPHAGRPRPARRLGRSALALRRSLGRGRVRRWRHGVRRLERRGRSELGRRRRRALRSGLRAAARRRRRPARSTRRERRLRALYQPRPGVLMSDDAELPPRETETQTPLALSPPRASRIVASGAAIGIGPGRALGGRSRRRRRSASGGWGASRSMASAAAGSALCAPNTSAIEDEEGVWIEAHDVALDWRPLDILFGAVRLDRAHADVDRRACASPPLLEPRPPSGAHFDVRIGDLRVDTHRLWPKPRARRSRAFTRRASRWTCTTRSLRRARRSSLRRTDSDADHVVALYQPATTTMRSASTRSARRRHHRARARRAGARRCARRRTARRCAARATRSYSAIDRRDDTLLERHERAGRRRAGRPTAHAHLDVLPASPRWRAASAPSASICARPAQRVGAFTAHAETPFLAVDLDGALDEERELVGPRAFVATTPRLSDIAREVAVRTRRGAA